MAASLASPQAAAFIVKHGSVIVSVGMKEENLDMLNLPLMSEAHEEQDPSVPAFTITMDAKVGVSTGVSASDKAKTVIDSSSLSKPEDFRRPGHLFPLMYRNGKYLAMDRTCL